MTRRLVYALLPAVVLALLAAAPAQAVRPGCTVSLPRAYSPTMAPDQGVRPAITSAHRGSVNLGPQQTEQAYLGAIAYGTDMVEVDLHRTLDGVLVVIHDQDPEGVGVQRRDVATMTLAEFKALNAAVAPWTGTAFDPARYLTFDEALAIMSRYGVGMDIEFKDVGVDRSVVRATAVKVQAAGIMGRTIWQHGPLDDIQTQVRSVDPNALFNVNIGSEPAEVLYSQAASTEFSFGSSLAEFTVDRIAAIHDGCGLSLPHSYDGLDDRDRSAAETERERLQMVAGLAKGVDGFQTNRPDAAADATGQPVPSRLVPGAGGAVCLVDAAYGLPLMNRPVVVDGVTTTSGRGGCVPGGQRAGFAGDGSALGAAPLVTPVAALPETPAALLLPLAGLAVGALLVVGRPGGWRSRRRSGYAAPG